MYTLGIARIMEKQACDKVCDLCANAMKHEEMTLPLSREVMIDFTQETIFNLGVRGLQDNLKG